jgi:hypothetical protein
MYNVSPADIARRTIDRLRGNLLPLLRRHAESGSPDVVSHLLAVAIIAGLRAEALEVLADVKNERGRLCPDHDEDEVAKALHRAVQWAAVIALRYRDSRDEIVIEDSPLAGE